MKRWLSIVFQFGLIFVSMVIGGILTTLNIFQPAWHDFAYDYFLEKPKIVIAGDMEQFGFEGPIYENLLSLQPMVKIEPRNDLFRYFIIITNLDKRKIFSDVIITLDFNGSIIDAREFEYKETLAKIETDSHKMRITFNELTPQSSYSMVIYVGVPEISKAKQISYEIVFTWDRGGGDRKRENIKGYIVERPYLEEKKESKILKLVSRAVPSIILAFLSFFLGYYFHKHKRKIKNEVVCKFQYLREKIQRKSK